MHVCLNYTYIQSADHYDATTYGRALNRRVEIESAK